MTPYVVCVGLATRDTIHAVPRHPGPDELVVASEFATAGGGPAATAAVAVARLGVPVFFVGAVGDDEAGGFVRESLERERVDVSELAVVRGARSPQSAVLVEGASRAIAAFRGELPALELTARARELCAGAAVVHVDQTGFPAAARLRHDVLLSVDGGNPIEGLALDDVSLYVPTEETLRRDARSAADALAAGARTVVVTRGADGSTAYTRGGEVIEAPGFPVDVVSTLGAGDVFHGALVAQLVRGVPLADALLAANACAALSCRALDGRSAIPTAAELESAFPITGASCRDRPGDGRH